MAIAAANLNGHRATSARVQVPARGAWYADASLDGEVTLTGAVTLTIADLVLKGTVISGGPAVGRSDYRIVAGAGGWGRVIPRKPYVNDAGVKLATILADAARESGETIVLPAASERVGPAWTRLEGRASLTLESVAPGAWYIDEAGVTRLGRRAAAPLAVKATVQPADKARRSVGLAAESIASILPGVIVNGIEAVDVLHEVSAEGGLRTTIWGARGPSTESRTVAAWRLLLEQLDPDRAFRGVWEYRVVTTEGKRLNLQPVRVSTGMPDLPRVRTMPGVSGCEADVKLGSRVLVAFVDSDPARPVVVAFEDAEGDGFVPTTITLAQGLLGVARMTDPVIAGPFAGTITMGSTKVRAG